MPQFTTDAIPYQEFRSINLLRRLHGEQHEARLRGLVAFGDLVRTGDTSDIHLLEIVEGWSGPRRVLFESTAELPLRGRLNLYFLTPEGFENPEDRAGADEEISISLLLNSVRDGYVVLLERPADYVRANLDNLTELTPTSAPSNGESPQQFFAHYAAEPSR